MEALAEAPRRAHDDYCSCPCGSSPRYIVSHARHAAAAYSGACSSPRQAPPAGRALHTSDATHPTHRCRRCWLRRCCCVCVLFADFDATTRLHYTLAARQEPTTNQPLNQLFTTWINATGTGGALVNATVVE